MDHRNHLPAYELEFQNQNTQRTSKSITYGPRKAVAEVSKDKEPIGKERAEFNWFESQLMSDSNALRFN